MLHSHLGSCHSSSENHCMGGTRFLPGVSVSHLGHGQQVIFCGGLIFPSYMHQSLASLCHICLYGFCLFFIFYPTRSCLVAFCTSSFLPLFSPFPPPILPPLTNPSSNLSWVSPRFHFPTFTSLFLFCQHVSFFTLLVFFHLLLSPSHLSSRLSLSLSILPPPLEGRRRGLVCENC